MRSLVLGALMLATVMPAGSARAHVEEAAAAAPRLEGFPVLRAWGEVRRGLEQLRVTPEQKEQIREVLRSRRKEWRAAADRAWETKKAVAEATFQDEVDEAAIRERVQAAAEAHAELAVLRARIRHEVRAVLTPEQRAGADRIRGHVLGLIEGLRTEVRDMVDEAIG